jgi:hypothetical protein
MTSTQRTALICLLLSCGLSVFMGFFLARNRHDVMLDFKAVYYDTRCLFLHVDPYKQGEPLRVYLADGERILPSEGGLRENLTWNIYLPATAIFIAPFAMLPWGPAHVMWMILTAVSLVLSGFLMWNFSAKDSPVLSGALICFILANSEVLFATGNPAGIVVCLCVVAVWCFLKERLVWAGVLCLAASLAIKPHDAGLVWLYFLLAGQVYRKRALQTLLVAVVLGLAALLWVTQISPHWMQELYFDLLAVSSPGHNSDPGLSNIVRYGPSMIIDLQSVISVFWNDPRIYDSASYLVCGALLLVWSVRTLRARISPESAWIALAAVVPLTLVVIYHRPYDAKLLLLTVPACCLLWAEGRPVRWVALVVSTAGIVLTSDFPLLLSMVLTKNMHVSTAGLSRLTLTDVLMRPTPLILLAMGIFYLWIYVRRDSQRGCP